MIHHHCHILDSMITSRCSNAFVKIFRGVALICHMLFWKELRWCIPYCPILELQVWYALAKGSDLYMQLWPIWNPCGQLQTGSWIYIVQCWFTSVLFVWFGAFSNTLPFCILVDLAWAGMIVNPPSQSPRLLAVKSSRPTVQYSTRLYWVVFDIRLSVIMCCGLGVNCLFVLSWMERFLFLILKVKQSKNARGIPEEVWDFERKALFCELPRI